MLVSGSRDLTCILWDLEELSYVTQLAGHTSSVSALATNDLTVSTACSPLTQLLVQTSFFPLSHLFVVVFGSMLACCSPPFSSQHEEGRILIVDSMHILFVWILLFCVHFYEYICTRGRNHPMTLSQGEIASCAGPVLYLWTMKGQLLTCTDISCGPQADILCVSFSQRHEWDARNVIVTGCGDGIIRVSFYF